MKLKLLSLLIGSLLFIACNNGPSDKRSPVPMDIHIERFEKELFSADPAEINKYIDQWVLRYGKFFSYFCSVAGLGNPSDPGFPERLTAFITDKNNYGLYKRTMEVFPDLDRLTVQINTAFSNFSGYFPDCVVPRVYTFISVFSQSAITDDSLLAIGLDRYLGSDEPIYREAGMYNYITKNMYPDRIRTDCMNFWAETEFPYNDSVNNLIANMIHQGRTLYFTRKILQDSPDTTALGFTAAELEYLHKNEKSMWAFLVDHKLLFSTDRFTISKFVLDGPFTTDFGRNSPARAAVWIGYRIIEAYMNRNREINLSVLMHERDYLKILNGSGYNP